MSYKLIIDYLTPNEWSRPQRKMIKIEWITVHWEANPNSSAKATRDFFERRKNGTSDYGSAHEIIDPNGSIILCIPKNEMAYHVGSKTYTDWKRKYMGSKYPNAYAYGIEVPHIDWDGNMTELVYNTLIDRVVDLLKENDLSYDKVNLHSHITGKDCHKYFAPKYNTINQSRWDSFMAEIKNKYLGIKGEENMTDKINLDFGSEIIKDCDKDTVLKLKHKLATYRVVEDEVRLYEYVGYDIAYSTKKNDDVIILQETLNKLGENLKNDGYAGRGTIKSLFNVTGSEKVNKQVADRLNTMLQALQDDKTNQPTVSIPEVEKPVEVVLELEFAYCKKGYKGETVFKLQNRLKELKYNIDIDKDFGGKTELVLKAFQEDRNINVNGICDSITINELSKNGDCIYQEFWLDKQTSVVKMRRDLTQTVLIDVDGRKTLKSIMGGLGWKPTLLCNGGLFNMTTKGEDLNHMIDTYQKAGSVYYSKEGMKMSHTDKLTFGLPDSTTKSFLGGSPILLLNGKVNANYPNLDSSYINVKHPRTSIGVDRDYIYIVMVRGRSALRGWYGVTIKQLTDIFIKLGCTDAQNNDGGASSGLLTGGLRWIMSSSRAVSNAIAFYVNRK